MIIPAELRALIVDDNDYARELASQSLKQLGIKSIFTAKTGAEGLQIARNNALSFVLLDWYMPEINGAGFIQLVRGEHAGCPPDLPIIVTTAYATRQNIRRIRDLGLKEVLIKPYDTKQLGLAVSTTMSNGQKKSSSEDFMEEKNQILL